MFSDQNCYLGAKVWSPGYSTSMQASCNRRCKNPGSEKQGEKEPCSDFGFYTCLLWLGEWGPEKGFWIWAMIYFFCSWLRVVQPYPGLVEGCQLWGLWLMDFKLWVIDSYKGLFGFHLLPSQMVLISSEQRGHHGWTNSMSWVMPTAYQWDHPGFSLSTNVSQVNHRTINFLRITIA